MQLYGILTRDDFTGFFFLINLWVFISIFFEGFLMECVQLFVYCASGFLL